MSDFSRDETVDLSFGSHDVGAQPGLVAVAWVDVDDGGARIDSCESDPDHSRLEISVQLIL